MISKTSFFNKGIYKSSIKRYAWGSVLYFIILFISTVLSVFLNTDRDFSHLPYDYFNNHPVILHGAYIVIPILLAIVVPTVAALMIFRFIHSKKQSIFIHSLPVSRKANYISSLLAGFTLMYVPIIINGGILILISLLGYGNYFTVSNCLSWIGYNLLGVFLMFSCAVFSANLTGNSFAMIAINILIHSFLFIIVLCMSVMSEAFLFGYSEGNIVYDSLMKNNFAVAVYGFSESYFREDLTGIKILEFIIAAFVLYVFSYFLYKKRRLETASDVAGYKCLNVIFKYFITFIITLFGFALFSTYMAQNTILFIFIITIISIIAYAASEMILKKTLNVLYSWKGYLGFALVFVALVLLFSQTSFFGYETRIPDKSQIKEASMYEYYYFSDEPYTANDEIIDLIINEHKGFVENDFPQIKSNDYFDYSTRIHIKYKLNDGRIFERVYPVSNEKCNEIMNRIFEYDDYVRLCENIFMDSDLIVDMYIDEKKIEKDYEEFLDILREETLNLKYEELHSKEYDKEKNPHNLRIEWKYEYVDVNTGKKMDHIRSEYFEINNKCVKSIEWINSNMK